MFKRHWNDSKFNLEYYPTFSFLRENQIVTIKIANTLQEITVFLFIVDDLKNIGQDNNCLMIGRHLTGNCEPNFNSIKPTKHTKRKGQIDISTQVHAQSRSCNL
jgi:hypothetical protein